jgi:hypothetical protein
MKKIPQLIVVTNKMSLDKGVWRERCYHTSYQHQESVHDSNLA